MDCKAIASSTQGSERETSDSVCADGAWVPGAPRPPANVFRHAGAVTQHHLAKRFRYEPRTFWLTGLSGAGKSTIAYELEATLVGEKQPCAVLDGDNLRHRLNCDLGFGPTDRRENVRRVAEVARLMNEAGLVVITALVSPYREDREMAKAIIGDERFVEVHVATPIEVCEARDVKGLYRRARRGEVTEFTGVSAPYEPPLAPALVVNTGTLPAGAAAARLHAYLKTQSQGRDYGVVA